MNACSKLVASRFHIFDALLTLAGRNGICGFSEFFVVIILGSVEFLKNIRIAIVILGMISAVGADLLAKMRWWWW